MAKNSFRAHPITAVILLRGWWFVFTAPIVRMVLQAIISNTAQQILLSEVVLLAVAMAVSITGWLLTKITATEQNITINRGIFIKSNVIIAKSGLSGVSFSKNLFYGILGCSECCFNTISSRDKGCTIKLSNTNATRLCNKLYADVDKTPLKRQNSLKRFLKWPIFAIFLLAFVVAVRLYLFGGLKGFEVTIILILLALILIYGLYQFYDYKYGKLCIGKTIFAKTVMAFGQKTVCYNKEQVGIIKILQNPFDRCFGTCNVKIKLVGESGECVKVKHIMFKPALNQIKNAFKTIDDV